MKRARVIPVLLLKGAGLYKTVRFREERYVGDPVNAVRIFNVKECDELILLDINASKLQQPVNFSFLEDIASECFMPLAYGGGINELGQIEKLLRTGIEKVILNTVLLNNPSFLGKAAKVFGSSTIVASVDVRSDIFRHYQLFSHSGCSIKGLKLKEFISHLEEEGAGELMINSVDHDGMMNGFDLHLASWVSSQISIPTIFCGGGRDMEDIKKLLHTTEVSAAAAGSMFVFQGPHRGVLITYPMPGEIEGIYNQLNRNGIQNML